MNLIIFIFRKCSIDFCCLKDKDLKIFKRNNQDNDKLNYLVKSELFDNGKEPSKKVKIKIPFIKDSKAMSNLLNSDQKLVFEGFEPLQNKNIHDYRENNFYKNEFLYDSSVFKKNINIVKNSIFSDEKSKRRQINSSLIKMNFSAKSPIMSRGICTTASSKLHKIPILMRPKREVSASNEIESQEKMNILSLSPNTKKANLNTFALASNSKIISRYIKERKKNEENFNVKNETDLKDCDSKDSSEFENEHYQVLEKDDSFHYLQNIF